MIDVTFLEIVWVVFTAMIGMIALGAGIIGYWYRPLMWIERIALIVLGLFMVYPESWYSAAGLAGMAILLVIQLMTKNKWVKPIAS